jgi:hypothetical protein
MRTKQRVDETARIMWAVFLFFWSAYAIAHTLITSGCNAQSRKEIANYFKDVAECTAQSSSGSLANVENQLLDSIDNAISKGIPFNSSQWSDTGKSLGINVGVNAFMCAASDLYREIEYKLTHPSDMGFTATTSKHRVRKEQLDYLKAVFNSAGK